MNDELAVVLTEDASSGRIHKRVREGGRLLVDERCNTDAAGAYEVIGSAVDADPARLCRYCFPEVIPHG
jgi:hypothetical protein